MDVGVEVDADLDFERTTHSNVDMNEYQISSTTTLAPIGYCKTKMN